MDHVDTPADQLLRALSACVVRAHEQCRRPRCILGLLAGITPTPSTDSSPCESFPGWPVGAEANGWPRRAHAHAARAGAKGPACRPASPSRGIATVRGPGGPLFDSQTVGGPTADSLQYDRRQDPPWTRRSSLKNKSTSPALSPIRRRPAVFSRAGYCGPRLGKVTISD